MYWWVSLATRRKANWCKPTNFQKSVQFEPGLCFTSRPMPYRYLYPKDLKPQLSSNQKASECYKWCFKSKAVSQWKWLQPSICAFENSVPIKPFFKDLTSAHILFLFKQAKFDEIMIAECKMWLIPQKLCILSTLPFLYVKFISNLYFHSMEKWGPLRFFYCH